MGTYRLEEDYCSYEISKKLHEKGFDWGTTHTYYGEYPDELFEVHYPCGINTNCNELRPITEPIPAPTLWEAQKWLREENGVIVTIQTNIINNIFYGWLWCIEFIDDIETIKGEFMEGCNGTYEEALSEGITKALSLLWYMQY